MVVESSYTSSLSRNFFRDHTPALRDSTVRCRGEPAAKQQHSTGTYRFRASSAFHITIDKNPCRALCYVAAPNTSWWSQGGITKNRNRPPSIAIALHRVLRCCT